MKEINERKAGAILSYVTIGVSILVQLLYTPFLMSRLGQSEYGLYSLASSVIGYLTVLDMGLGNAIIVYTAKYRAEGKYDEEKKLHGMFFAIFLVIGFVAGTLGLILYTLVPNMFGKTMTSAELSRMKIMMLILTFNLVMTFSFSIYGSILSAYEKFTYLKVISILNVVVRTLVMIPLLFMGFKSIALTIVMTLANVTVVFSNYLYCKNKLGIRIRFLGFDKTLLKTVFGFSFYIFLGIVVDKVNWNADQFILGSVCGTIAVSVYSIAGTLNTMFMNMSTAISGVMLPKMTKMVSENADSEMLTDEMIKVGRVQSYLIFLMASGLILFGKEFIFLWVGDGFKESYYVALLLIIPTCFPLVQNLGLNILQAMNKYRFKSISTTIMAFFNIIISFFLAKRFGAVGAAAGTAIAVVVCNIILINIYYYKEIKINIIKFWKSIFRALLPATIPIIIMIILKNLIVFTGYIGFVCGRGIYTLLYCIAEYLFSMNNYEKDLIKSFTGILKSRIKN